ncbi:hypothetical protein ABEW34_01910 [Paenibacillus algorifonticola]|uniref:hypothetical protein n=1 Tax=Paenibacillus algorifonticola TaxID=684063 RepID=UPI003D2D645B
MSRTTFFEQLNEEIEGSGLNKKILNGGYQEEFYTLCRSAYLVIFNAKIGKNEGQLQCFIDESTIENFSIDVSSYSALSGESPEDIMSVVRIFYIQTATDDERKSRRYVDSEFDGKTFGYRGTYYNSLDEFPNWDDFEKSVLKKIH